MGRQKETQENTLHGGIGIFLLTTVTKAPSAVYLYMGLLGPNHPKSAWAKLDNRIYTAGQQAFIDNPDLVGLLELLGGLYQVSGYETMLKAYKAGKISPELMDFLNNPPPFIPANITAMEGPSGAATFKNEVLEAAKAGKLDFSSFNLTGDKSPDWFAKYRLAPNPIPGILGSIKNLTVKIDGFQDKSGGLNGFKENIIETAEKTVKNALENGASPAAILAIAEETKRYYEKHKKEGITASNNNIFRNKSEYEAGFVVDMETGTIQDLRGYAAELAELVEPGIEPLNEFSKLLKKAVKQYSKVKTPASIFEKAYAPMYNFVLTNQIVNVITTNSGRQQKGQKLKAIIQNRGQGITQTIHEFQYREIIFQQDLTENKWVLKKNGVEMRLPIKTNEKTGEILPPMLTWNTWRAMLFILVLFTEHSESPIVETTIQEFLLATGTPDTKQNRNEAQKLLKRELQALSEMELQYRKGRYEFMKRQPFPDITMKNGKIRIGLSPEFVEYLTKKTNFLMTLKTGILRLKSKSPAVNQLAYYLNLHRGNDHNIEAGTANIVSVENCLKNCPSIPTIQEVRASRTSPDKRIIEMFNWCMDTAVEQDILQGWHYCGAKGEPLEDLAVTGYDYFISLYIWYEFKDFPAEERAERAADNAEKRRKRKERIDRLTDAAIAKKRAAAATEKE